MKYEKEAAKLLAAIKRLAANEYGADEFESYLSYHFPVWLESYANTPGGLLSQLSYFSYLEEGEEADR